MSYAAAERLDMINEGVAQVEFTKLREMKYAPAINFDKRGMFLAETSPHDIYDKLNIGRGEALYTQK